jgi:hypothetical protein
MMRVAVVVLLILYVVNAQVLYSTEPEKPPVKCLNNPSTTCYTQIYVPDITNMVPISRNYRFHISDVYTSKELCSFTRTLISKAQNATNTVFTCVDYFSDASLIAQALPHISYTPLVYQGFGNAQPWWQPHFDIRNYCYYCDHATRDQFLTLVTNYSSPYFWKHSLSYGNDGANKFANPTFLSAIHESYVNSKRAQLQKRDPVNNVTDFLFLTALRNAGKDEIGEENREEYPYQIYCGSYNKFGVKCDAYVWLLNPVRYAVWPIIDYVVRVFIIILMVIFLWIPKINGHVKQHLKGVRTIPRFVWEVVTDLKILCIFFMTIGIPFVLIEDIGDFKTTQAVFQDIRGLFRIAGGLFTIMGFLTLLVFWSHIYHSSQAMDGEKLNIWNKLALTFFYISSLLIALIAAILYAALPDQRMHVFIALMSIAVIYFFLLVVGFFIYGIRMFCMLRKSNNVNFLKLKFTKFMMVIMVLFLHIIVWMIILTVEFSVPGKTGLFTAIMRGPLMDLSLLLLYPFVIYMLFERPKFFAVGINAKIRDCFIRAGSRIKEKAKRKSDRHANEHDEELKTSLLAEDYNEEEEEESQSSSGKAI